MQCKPNLRLSPNETQEIISTERKKWRIFRLQQVRAQANEEAHKCREAVKNEEKKQIAILEQQLAEEWNKINRQKQLLLEENYVKSLKDIGHAHRNAKTQVEILDLAKFRKLDNDRAAIVRGKKAFQLLEEKKSESRKKQVEIQLKKKIVAEKEKKRAIKVANLPTPPRLKYSKRIEEKDPKKVMFYEAGTLTTSAYVPSAVKVIREEMAESKLNAAELANREKENMEETEKKKELRDKEVRRKVRERGKAAWKKEKTKEMYSKLLEELEQAQDTHQLSEYLKGEEWINCDSNSFDGKVSEEEKRRAEEKVEKLLGQHFIEEEERPITFEIADDAMTEKGLNSRTSQYPQSHDESDDGAVSRDTREFKSEPLRQNLLSETSSTNNGSIHFKETIQVDKLPFVKENFKDHRSENASCTTSCISSSVTESSFEEIGIRIAITNKNPTSEKSSYLSNENAHFSHSSLTLNGETSTEDTEYFYSPQNLIDKLDHYQKTKVDLYDSIKPRSYSSSTSSSFTNYLGISKHASPVKEGDTVHRNLKLLEEGRKKIQRVVDEMKQVPKVISLPVPVQKFPPSQTPPRIYTKPIKMAGSGQRPQCRRQKFEQKKKILLEYYMQRLLIMKHEELNQVSASTVADSGIDLSSETHIKELMERMEVLSSSNSSSYSPSRHTKSREVEDEWLEKQMTLSEIVSKLPSTSVSSSVSSQTFSYELRENNRRKQHIYTRLLQLQQLKQLFILLQQKALGQTSKAEEEELKLLEETIHGLDAPADPCSRDVADNSNAVNYSLSTSHQTPEWRDSTPSLSKFSVSTLGHLSESCNPVEDGVDNVHYNKAIPTKQPSFQLSQEFLNRTEDRGRSFKRASGEGSPPPYERNSLPLNSPGRLSAGSSIQGANGGWQQATEPAPLPNDEHSSSIFSSATSIPDMTKILQDFGLGWAVTMIKKMDDAEEIKSSDSTVR